MENLLEELEKRGLLQDTTDRVGLAALLEQSSPGDVRVYCGFDPTANSLQIGNLIPLIMLNHFQRAGCKPVLVSGGFTGKIGDPSGKASERPLLDEIEVGANVVAQRPIFERLLSFDNTSPIGALCLNNDAWLGRMPAIEFLRDFGKHMSLGEMLKRDSVRLRIDREQGMSMTEFSYSALQAIDFHFLFRDHGVRVQLGGSDQWGNIVGGVDLVRRIDRAKVFGLTCPLIAKTDGTKFGKTETDSIWLSADRTTPYQFYQFFLTTSDADVVDYLRRFTFLPLDEIDEIEKRHHRNPEAQVGQRLLARAVTALVHGDDRADEAMVASGLVFSGQFRDLSESRLAEAAATIPSSSHSSELIEHGLPLLDLLVAAGVASSKREGREVLLAGAIEVNGETSNVARVITRQDLLHDRFLFLKRGKRRLHATRWA